MPDSVFIAERDRFMPTEHARGPWDRDALHGGAPAALLAAAFERTEPGSELRIARLGFEFLRPIPLSELTLSVRIVRQGRRVQELAGELRAAARNTKAPSGDAAHGLDSAGTEVVCRASALRVAQVPADVPSSPRGGQGAVHPAPGRSARSSPAADAAMSAPDTGKPIRFALADSADHSFGATAMEMRWLSDPRELGRGRVWMRLRQPLLPAEPPTPLMHLAAAADFGNGVSAELPFDRFLFINADLSIHLHRPPRGEWIGLDARTLLHAGGMGLAESVLHDEHGAVGRAFQTLVVQRR